MAIVATFVAAGACRIAALGPWGRIPFEKACRALSNREFGGTELAGDGLILEAIHEGRFQQPVGKV
jgi:hypothetical protein